MSKYNALCALRQNTTWAEAAVISSAHIFSALLSCVMAPWFTTVHSGGSLSRAEPPLRHAPVSCSAEGFYKPLYICEVGGYGWQKQLPSMTIKGGVGQRMIEGTSQGGFLLSSLIFPIIYPLINSLLHREIAQGSTWLQSWQLSTSKWDTLL